jgi:hypothetical protein
MSNRAGLIAALVLLVLLILTPQIAPLLHLAISVCTEVLLFAIISSSATPGCYPSATRHFLD